jgi:hypothetical protein
LRRLERGLVAPATSILPAAPGGPAAPPGAGGVTVTVRVRFWACSRPGPGNLITGHPSRFGILREERIRAGINANRRLYSRRTCPFIPAGLSLYSRRAVLLFPQGCPFIPVGLAQQPRAAFSSCPACADGDPWPGSVPPGMRAREDSALTEVGCCPQAAAACKLRDSPSPGPQLEQGT